MCSPDYAHKAAQPDWVDWLLQAELIDLEDNHWNWMNWRLWLGGKDIDAPLRHRNLQINSYPLVIEAACQGLGVALGWQHLVNELLDQGRLVRPFEESIKTEFGYYLIYRESLHQEITQTRVRDWLLQLFNIDAAES